MCWHEHSSGEPFPQSMDLNFNACVGTTTSNFFTEKLTLFAEGHLKDNLVLWIKMRMWVWVFLGVFFKYLYILCFGTGGIPKGEDLVTTDCSRLEVAHSPFPTEPAAKGRSTLCTSTAVVLSMSFQNLCSYQQLKLFCALLQPHHGYNLHGILPVCSFPMAAQPTPTLSLHPISCSSHSRELIPSDV